MAARIARIALTVQGGYYLATGLWAIADLRGFTRFVRYGGDPFLKHTIAMLVVLVGSALLYSARQSASARAALSFGAVSAAALALPELAHLPEIWGTMLLGDLFLEGTFVLIAALGLFVAAIEGEREAA